MPGFGRHSFLTYVLLLSYKITENTCIVSLGGTLNLNHCICMTVKTCLLVTDDPDDHQAFSEAFSDVSSEAIVLNVLDSAKALLLLNSKKHIPDYLFLDISMHGIRINSFLKAARSDPAISRIPTVLYGLEADISKVDEPRDMIFFNKEYGYTDLRNFLWQFTQSHSKQEGDAK